MAPAMMTDRIIAGPATPATIPVTMKIPEPMIAPMPSAVAPKRPISRFRTGTGLGIGHQLPFFLPVINDAGRRTAPMHP